MNLPNMKKPCAECPFRKDTQKGWLAERIEEIIECPSFICHKTVNYEQYNFQGRLQCAGHMLLRGEKNIFVKAAKKMGIPTGVTGRKLIFDTEQHCIDHHKNR